METQVVNPASNPDWDRLVSLHPEACIFHSAAWSRVLSRTYAHQPVYLCCSHQGSLAALVPMMEIHSALTGRRGVCLPFSDYCCPLIFNKDAHSLVIDQLVKVAQERKWRYFEVRGGPAPHVSATPAVGFYGHTLDLRCGAETVIAQSEGSVRRALRKAARSGLSVEAGGEGMPDFYKLHVQTRRRHGLPPQPLSFFMNIAEEIIKPGAGLIVLARSGSIPVAGAVFFQFGGKAFYKFGASNKAYQEFRGNDLVMREGIERLARQGCETLHFGRTSIGNDGLRRFKRAWGTIEERLEYFKFDMLKSAWVAHRDNAKGFYNAVFGRLPIVVNRLAGAMIYPHLD